MPIISRVGSRSWRVRLLYGTIFFVLGLGALSMIYPLLLMISGSVKSEVDYMHNTPVPRFLHDDDVLWAKYLQSKYDLIGQAEQATRSRFGSWVSVRPPAEVDVALAEHFRQFRAEVPWPREWYTLGHAESNETLAKNGRLFRQAVQARYESVDAYSEAVGIRYPSWSHVHLPIPPMSARRFLFPDNVHYQLYYEFKAAAPPADWVVVQPDAVFVHEYLMSIWPTIEDYNRAHAPADRREDYSQVVLATDPPPHGQARDDWEVFVRNDLNVAYIRLRPAALAPWQRFLTDRYAGSVERLNREWRTDYAGFERIALPQGLPASSRAQADLGAFVRDPAHSPLDALSVYGPRQAFETYLAQREELPHPTPVLIPTESVDWLDFQEQKGALRWEFVQRNFLAVFDYILLHGNGVRNTLIFCTLMVGSQLLINPLAAYALSRYKPPTTYTILLFCMATMAFPAEVTMIPSFLLLKQFPLYSLGVAALVMIAVTWLLHRLRPQTSVLLIGLVGLGLGIAAGWWLTPWVANQLFGRSDTHVSLLNSFWALVLPSMANGFSIFLLKGFFDSLPRELYEAADIDGANEWHKFWVITMSLSKPILAVLALGAFTAAYSEFMMALVVIPDQEMWTIMVWLFQLQSSAHQTVIYASLVVAAIPTFLVFLFCQNLIMRGIVVPTEK